MSMTIDESSPRDMVKPPVTRKSRQHQTAVERWSTLKQNSERSFDRLNVRNRFEEERLLEKRRTISQLSEAQLKEIFRIKDEMRVALIDIAKSKRQYNRNESDFESLLRSGKQSPMFKMEYRRLRRKKVELEKLGEQLKGPNAKLLATNLASELRSVEQKAESELNRPSKFKGMWLAPLKNIQKAAAENPSPEGELTDDKQPTQSTGNDFANLVKMVHKQFKETSISESTKSEAPKENRLKAEGNKITESKARLPKIASKPLETGQTEPENVRKDTRTEGGLYPVSRPPKSLIPIDQVESDCSKECSHESNRDVNLEVKGKKRQRKCTKEMSLPTLAEIPESRTQSPRAETGHPTDETTHPTVKTGHPAPQTGHTPTETSHMPAKVGHLPAETSHMPAETNTGFSPKPKRSKRQKARNILKKNVRQVVSTGAPISRTESARRRDRFVRKRLSDLATKTKEDITHRRSITPHDDALNSIHQAEVVTRLQLARSKVGITLPELKTRKSEEVPTPRNRKNKSVSLPPLNLEGNLLRELKEQRRRHKNQSTGLPKLP